MRKQVIQGKASQCGCHLAWAPQVAQTIKYLPAMWETQVQSLGWEDPLEEGMANPLQDSCLENPHGQRSLVGYSLWGCRVGHDLQSWT